jgi:hypothetical protein
MRFTAEHRFDASPEQVGALMVDPDFEASVALPDLSLPEVLEHGTDGEASRLRLRYEYTGEIDSIVRRLLGGRKLILVQEVRLQLLTGRGTYALQAEADPGRVGGHATIALAASAEGGSTRRFAGDFSVKVPLVGGSAERRLLPGILRRFDIEAAALAARVQPSG